MHNVMYRVMQVFVTVCKCLYNELPKQVLAFEVLGHGTQLSMYDNKIFGLQCTPGSSSRNLGSKVKGELKNLRGYL